MTTLPEPTPWTAYGETIASRLMIGTAGYPSPAVLRDAIAASGAGVVTVGLRRTLAAAGDNGFLAELLQDLRARGVKLLPNTAGCHTAREAVALAHMARELYGTHWIKLEVTGDEHTLQPDPWGTVEAAADLVRAGFAVFPYCTDDLVTCQRLLDAGCEVLMPWVRRSARARACSTRGHCAPCARACLACRWYHRLPIERLRLPRHTGD